MTMARRTIPLALFCAALALVVAALTSGSGGAPADTAYAAKPPTRTPAPTRTPTPVPPTPTPSAACSQYPGQILNLTNWKLTLPLNSSGGLGGDAAEILQPQLATYCNDPYFAVNGSGVQFRAPVNGATTSGSSYPRSELREMTNNGSTLASWSTTSGVHTMIIDQAITTVPATKKHVVAGQIHDSADDVITVRLEYPKLFVDHNGVAGNTLTANYVLGTRFTVKFEASGGQIRVYYNGSATPNDTLSRSGSGMYFKAGDYTQSNCGTDSPCSATNYGEVIIYGLTVTHQ